MVVDCLECGTAFEPGRDATAPYRCRTCHAHPSSSSLTATLVTRATGRAESHAEISITPEFRERFALGPLLGCGAVGAVYRAQRLSDGTAVAVKFLVRPSEEHLLDRFLAEGRMLSQIHHGHVVTVHEIGLMDGYPYLVTELVPGGTLDAQLALARRLPLARAAAVAADVLAALQAIHESGIVHRDVKPANILLTEAGRAKLADLGVAKHFGEVDRTLPGQLVGTPLYMPPEQLHGGAVTVRADLFAVGAVLYHLISGRPPYPGPSLLQIVAAHERGAPPTLGKLVADVPSAVDGLVSRALSPRQSERHASAADMALVLRRAVPGLPEPLGAGQRSVPVRRAPAPRLSRGSPVPDAPPPHRERAFSVSGDASLVTDRYKLTSWYTHHRAEIRARAVDRRGGHSVWLRIPRDPDAIVLSNFQREAARAARVRDVHVVELLALEQAGPFPMAVYEFVNGRCLATAMAGGLIQAKNATGWLLGVLKAVDAVHRAGLTHGALHPGKILITDSGVVKLAGLQRVGKSTMEMPGMIEPEHVAPDDGIDARTDIYLAGSVLYQALTGELPGRDRRPPSALAAGIPPRLDAAVMRALEVEPANRFQSAEEMAVTLRTAFLG